MIRVFRARLTFSISDFAGNSLIYAVHCPILPNKQIKLRQASPALHAGDEFERVAIGITAK